MGELSQKTWSGPHCSVPEISFESSTSPVSACALATLLAASALTSATSGNSARAADPTETALAAVRRTPAPDGAAAPGPRRRAIRGLVGHQLHGRIAHRAGRGDPVQDLSRGRLQLVARQRRQDVAVTAAQAL